MARPRRSRGRPWPERREKGAWGSPYWGEFRIHRRAVAAPGNDQEKWATVNFVEHISEDTLEDHAIRSRPEPELATLEERLLLCAECRERLLATDQYVDAMRASAERITERGTGEHGSDEPADRPFLSGDTY